MKTSLILLFLAVILFGCKPEPLQPSSNTQGGGFVPVSATAELRTSFSEDWDNWSFSWGDTSGFYRTAFSEDWDNWNYRFDNVQGSIRTSFSEDWDNWQLGNFITIKTNFSEDWDSWVITDQNSPNYITVRTSFSEDWDNWDVFLGGVHIMDLQTNFSEDYDNWRIYGDNVELSNKQRAAIMFIPVFSSALYQQGIIQ